MLVQGIEEAVRKPLENATLFSSQKNTDPTGCGDANCAQDRETHPEEEEDRHETEGVDGRAESQRGGFGALVIARPQRMLLDCEICHWCRIAILFLFFFFLFFLSEPQNATAMHLLLTSR